MKQIVRLYLSALLVMVSAGVAQATVTSRASYRNSSTEAVVAVNNCSPNQNLDSIRGAALVLASTDRLAPQHLSIPEMEKRLDQFSNNSRNHIAEHSGCKLIKVTNASCYGRGDGFEKGHFTSHGLHYKPSMMSAAYPDDSMLYGILVVRNPKTNIAREIVITDKGPSKKMQRSLGRGIDLSAGAMDALGVRCPSVIKGLEIYNCASPD